MKWGWTICLFLSTPLWAQDEPVVSESQLEATAERNDQEESSNSLIDPFIQKIYINEAGKSELQEIPGLSAWQIEQLLRYRDRLGKLVSVYELQAIPGWDLGTIKKMQPFISLEWKGQMRRTLKERLHHGQQLAYIRFGRTLEKAAGFSSRDSSGFLGSPYQLQLRYGYNYRSKFGWGFSAVNQAGETFGFLNGKTGFDRVGAHLYVRDIGTIRMLALGNFKINFGQGLICWQGTGFSKSAEVIAVKREAPVIQPSVSGGETGYFTGAAIAFEKKKWELAVFGSRNRKDANLESDTVRSVLYSGLHRTAGEIRKRGNLLILAGGLQAGYSDKSFSVHYNALAEKWDHILKKKATPYNLYAPTGALFFNHSVDYSFTFRNMHVFGELASNERKAMAAISGLMISLEKRVSMAFIARYISASYYSWNGNAFVENSFPTNEKGVYGAISIAVSNKITLSSYLDVFSFPWLKFGEDRPGSGRSSFWQLSYSPDKMFQCYFRFRTEWSTNKKVTSIASGNNNYRVQHFFRAHAAMKINDKQSFQCRIEATNVNNELHGMIFYVGLKQQFTSIPVKADCRLQYTACDEYASRIYAYESDLPYSYSVLPFYGNYIRYYLNVSFRFPKSSRKLTPFSLYFKWSQNFRLNDKPFATGINAVDNFSKTNVVAQVIYRK